MEKTLILTGTTNILPLSNHPANLGSDDDNTYEEVFETTLPSKIRYAKKYGYDLLCLRSFGTAPNTGFKDTNIGLLRALRSFEMLYNYDVVMWIDADSLITNDSISINDFGLDDNNCLYASYDWPNWAKPTSSFTTGNFILKKNKLWKTLFDSFLLEGKRFTEGYGEELSALNWIYKNTDIKKIIKILDPKYLNSVPSLLADRRLKMYGDITSEESIWNHSHFLCHLTGLPNKIRLQLLNNEFKEYV